MAGVPNGLRTRRVGPLALLALLLTAAPGHVNAAEDGSVVLADDTLMSMPADLDGDGARELVAVRRHPDDRERIVVEAWGMGAGAWESLGSTPLETWDAGAAAPRPALFGREGFGLLSVRDGSRTRAIVATGTSAGSAADICCLSISVVGVEAAGISLDLLQRTLPSAESLHVADLEGDGTDEILAAHTTNLHEGSTIVRDYALLRQVGDGFEPEAVVLEGDEPLSFSVVLESDGVPGDDLLFTDETNSRVVRVADDHGQLRAETADGEAFGRPRQLGWPAGANDGLIGWVHERGISAVRWPRDGVPEVVAELTTSTFPVVALLGAGSNARWIQFAGFGPGGNEDLATRIYDANLKLERVIDPPALSRQISTAMARGPLSATVPDRYLWESIGLIPGGVDDRPAVLGHGSLLSLEPDGLIRVEPAAHFVGVGVIGTVGAGDGWLAVAGEWWGSGPAAYLGNIGYEPAFGMLGVVPMAEALDPSRGTAPVVEISGATLIGTGGDRRLFTSDARFQLTVRAAPGDLVVAYDELRTATETVTGDSVTLTIDPPGRNDRNQEFELSVFVLGPTGLTSGVSWRAEALRVAPEVTAAAAIEAFALQATISGQVTSGSTLTVDGMTVVPSPSGAFRVRVDAPIWPRDVAVVARDPLGNETTHRLQVIGFVDYRGLPWIPIVGTLTVAAGLALFVHAPRRRPDVRLLPDGDGRLEEIDDDRI